MLTGAEYLVIAFKRSSMRRRLSEWFSYYSFRSNSPALLCGAYRDIKNIDFVFPVGFQEILKGMEGPQDLHLTTKYIQGLTKDRGEAPKREWVGSHLTNPKSIMETSNEGQFRLLKTLTLKGGF